jgi:Concanavalin A-like lectin/glucanases superfamily
MSDNGAFNSFSTTGRGSFGPREFLESNSLVAKFAFLLLVIFGFIILLRVGISVISYLFKPNESPHLIDGMVDASQMIVFQQDPSNNGAVTIYRSVNANDGIEFTWSVWLFINNIFAGNSNSNTYKHIFSKGNSNLQENGLIYPNNAPGLYLAPNSNTLVLMMNTFNVINEEILIPDIPISKWVNVIIRCQNTTLDVYVNGTIARSINLVGVPKQNYGDVYVAMNGGFDGYISNLWYYNYALGTAAIQRIAANGPNTKMIGNNGMTDRFFNYLSLRWFFYGAGDSFNPYGINGGNIQ